MVILNDTFLGLGLPMRDRPGVIRPSSKAAQDGVRERTSPGVSLDGKLVDVFRLTDHPNLEDVELNIPVGSLVWVKLDLPSVEIPVILIDSYAAQKTIMEPPSILLVVDTDRWSTG